jgi:hypothetical protein
MLRRELSQTPDEKNNKGLWDCVTIVKMKTLTLLST